MKESAAATVSELDELRALVAHQESLLAQLRAQIDWLKRQLFGRKSERVDQRQLELMLKGLEERAAQLEASLPDQPKAARKAPAKPQPTRAERYGNLPVREVVVIEPEEVKAQPEAFERIGQEETFEVDVDPPQFYRRQVVRPKYRRRDDRNAAPVVAPALRRPVEGIASIGLLVHLILSKYADHLPLYRQSRMYEREGVQIPRQSMMRWVEVVSDWLKPIYAHIGRDLLEGGYIQADETPVNYLDADLKKGKAEQGYLCGYSRPDDNVLFAWRTSRSTAALTDFLEDFKGILQCDAYAAYQKFARGNESVTLVGCMAHVRRKFEQALSDHPREGALILLLIGKLYEVEKHCREHAYGPEETVAYRQKHALNIFNRLHRVIRSAFATTLPGSTLGKACKYALVQWEHLRHYLDHGQVRIDNNLMENAIRPSAIGKKNWLFIGHPQAGERSAIIYSLLASCQRFGHNPRAYLIDVLTRLAEEPDRFHPRDIHALTPKGWNPPA